ncbi:c-type cytochrome [Ramlibacter sp. AN1133]|uniref:c-type cytochrome n=1 Tax=Ramlibacter sp. AN1133 TaxID=3133429 RepID=UPI0030C2FD74
MKAGRAACLLLPLALLTGCADLSRSRDLGNPRVSAVTLAGQVCSNCHGFTGVSVSPNFPNLAAQTPEYLSAQLKEFRSHGRKDPAGFRYMWGLSRSLTDEQIAGLAAYYAAQAPASGLPGAGSPAGRTIYLEGVPARNVPACATCHGAEGQGNATFPRLAGQHRDYVAKQLKGFQRTDDRPAGAVMQTIAHALGAEDIVDIASYVQGLPGTAPAR